jgi:hypothetical protein
MRAIPSICVAFWLLSGSAACSSGYTLDITLQVPARRQAEYSDYPAQLVLLVDPSSEASIAGPEGDAQRVANLCSDSGEDFQVYLQIAGEDCAQLPRFVQAWLEPREEGSESKCGPLDEATPLRGVRQPRAETLYAEAEVFEDFSGSCGGLHSAVTLKLGW